MATADEQAIIDEGIALGDFPPIERDLDYIINQYLPTAGLSLIQDLTEFSIVSAQSAGSTNNATYSQTFSFTHTAVLTTDSSLSSSSDFTIDTIASVDNIVGIVSSVDFEMTSETVGVLSVDIDVSSTFDFETSAVSETSVLLDQAAEFIVENNAQADPELLVSVSHDFAFATEASIEAISELGLSHDFTVTSQASAVNDVEAIHSATVDVVSETFSDVEIVADHDTDFIIEHVGEIEPEVVLQESVTFNLSHTLAAEVSVDTTYSVDFDVTHVANLFAVEPAYLDSATTFDISTEFVANNPYYYRGNVRNIPTWPFEPNWSGSYTESMEWLTDVLVSSSGAEQRRSLRPYPRKTLEFSCAIGDSDMNSLRQFLEAHGARTIYLPQWHEAYRSTEDLAAGTDFIPCLGVENGGIRIGDIIFIGGKKARQYELAEVIGLSPTGISLKLPLEKNWPAFAKVHPARVARLDDQPSLRKLTDRAISLTATFRIMERNDDYASVGGSLLPTLDVYEGFNVLNVAPDDGDNIEFVFNRVIDQLDNETSIPQFFDVAGIPFPTQKHNWVLNGRQSYAELQDILFRLRGRWAGVWLPSFTNDMTLVAPTPTGDQYLVVENFGFTQSGGVQVGHDRIVVLLADGSREYRRIISSTTLDDDTEVIGLDQGFDEVLTPEDIVRISFMRLSRLDQDRVEIVHMTDTAGISRCSTTFRAAPPLRNELPGF